MLEDHERAYLKGLQENAVWIGILKKLATAKPAPRYMPSKDNNYDRWVYESGGLAATEAVISVLSLSEVKTKEEK